MLAIVSAGIAPGFALLSYFYLRDKYEAEPIITVLKAFLFGVIITFPIMFIQYVFSAEELISSSLGDAFLSTSLLEEFIKWFILFYAIYTHVDFDEPYDGIVYATSISLGFATIENILYLIAHGVEFAVTRALLPVSSHALFGVIMGYYFGKAKFSMDGRTNKWLFLAFFLPYLLHGLYDYILFIEKVWVYYMIPFMLFLWWLGLKKVKKARILTDRHHYKMVIKQKSSSL
ncbi:RsiW-degrading membrane proteinase PrsW (M82 family) [Oikeobacillus pervagus]|uniref:Protease PrsW n=1 Tax=Oikeobacillus pervagus TaxID=1325931 RepID=A0AAJ1WHV8_9BACI|nr:glutamic-type intramembrane protease PrsW [Oikeobacillus pervagus]MDQ0213718.1 RsiW-degrading membrane proteinase PrsW (M82 family) [Oikeobacillus pervagus]